jgi:hypothetical protein
MLARTWTVKEQQKEENEEEEEKQMRRGYIEDKVTEETTEGNC